MYNGELSPLALRRIMKERQSFDKDNLQEHRIYHHFDDDRMHKASACIMGPPGTPYAHGFYLFRFTFPNNYPSEPPRVGFWTGDGRIRFNPNLYENGKVCLSILGTWPGPSWTSACTFRTTLLSLQSLFCSHPLQNEPGYEDAEIDGEDCCRYEDMLRYENIAISVMQLERALPDVYQPLRGVMELEFLDHYADYRRTLNQFCEQFSPGFCQECGVFGFTTVYEPTLVMLRLEELMDTIRANAKQETDEATAAWNTGDKALGQSHGTMHEDISVSSVAIGQKCVKCLSTRYKLMQQGQISRGEEDSRRIPRTTVGPARPDNLEHDSLRVCTCRARQSQIISSTIVSEIADAQQNRCLAKMVVRLVLEGAASGIHSDCNVSLAVEDATHDDVWSVMEAELSALGDEETAFPCLSRASRHPLPAAAEVNNVANDMHVASMQSEECPMGDECPICLGRKTRPVELPCGHEFCADCLLGVVADYGKKECPCCRGPLTSSHGKAITDSCSNADASDWEEGASWFSSNEELKVRHDFGWFFLDWFIYCSITKREYDDVDYLESMRESLPALSSRSSAPGESDPPPFHGFETGCCAVYTSSTK